MSETPDNFQRTEEPTRKRLEDARKKGDAPKSPEVTFTAGLVGALAIIFLMGLPRLEQISARLVGFIGQPHAISTESMALVSLFRSLSIGLGAALLVPALVLMGILLTGHLVQARPVLNGDKIKPDLKRLSLIAGAKRIFGPQGLVNFLKGFAKLVVFGVIVSVLLYGMRTEIVGLTGAAAHHGLGAARSMVVILASSVIAVMVVIAAADYAWQVRSWKQRLKMTREEIRREQKETDGDPQTKARQRRARETQSRRRAIVAVQEATIVIVNPTHFAVALAYDAATGEAPVCTAKGLDDLALRMRAVARAHDVPVVENRLLARTLHAAVEIDEAIPVEHYEAVAKVIAFVQTRAGDTARS